MWLSVILMDLEMPGCGGLEAARRLRAGGYRGLLLACSGGTGLAEQDKSNTREAGFDGLLRKPMDRSSVIDRLRSLSERIGVALRERK